LTWGTARTYRVRDASLLDDLLFLSVTVEAVLTRLADSLCSLSCPETIWAEEGVDDQSWTHVADITSFTLDIVDWSRDI
jgi:hypothetical protein